MTGNQVSKNRYVRSVVSVVLAVMAVVISFCVLGHTMKTSHYIRDIETVNTICESMASKLSSDFAYADLLELMVSCKQGEVSEEDFNFIAEKAVKENASIDSLQLAPEGVITYIYPIVGNEEAMGLELLEDSEYKRYIDESIETGKIVAQGPVISLQGKRLVFGRKAIMLNNKLWGVAVIAVDFDKLLDECGLLDEYGLLNDDLNFEYAIATYNTDEGTPDYVYGDSYVLENSDACKDIRADGYRWRIAVKYRQNPIEILQSYGVYLLASLLIGVAVYSISKAYARKLEKSKTDPLTNTINSNEFKKQAVSRLKNSRDSVCAMLSIELDGFREIDNIYGHTASDKVLVYTTERMRSAIRTDDLVSRATESEFLILLSDIRSEEQVLKVIERIRELSEQDIPIGDGETQVNVYLSVGYAISSQNGSDYMVLYKTADERMYADKSERRGNI